MKHLGMVFNSKFWFSTLLFLGAACLKLSPTERAAEGPPSLALNDDTGGTHWENASPVFAEDPRELPTLSENMGKADFPISHPSIMPAEAALEAQNFFNQGISQLHGFSVTEARKSFLKVKSLQPNHAAMANFGLAMSHTFFQSGNVIKAKRYWLQAQSMVESNALTRYEKDWISSLGALYDEKAKGVHERYSTYVNALNLLVKQYPSDIEAKTFLALATLESAAFHGGKADPSFLETITTEVLKVAPLHIGALANELLGWNFFQNQSNNRIHTQRGIELAARIGQLAPSFDQVWHLAGATFEGLGRHYDAFYHFNSAVRVANKYLEQTRTLPYQLPNYCSHVEHLVDQYLALGNVSEAINFSHNLTEIPYHPVWNNLSDSGSCAAIAQRLLIKSLYENEMWARTVLLSESVALSQPSANILNEIRRLRLLSIAFIKADPKASEKLQALKAQMAKISSLPNLPDDALVAARLALAEISIFEALELGEKSKALAIFDRYPSLKGAFNGKLIADSGNLNIGLQFAKNSVMRNPNRAVPLATEALLLATKGDVTAALADFEKLKMISEQIDVNLAVIQKLILALKLDGPWVQNMLTHAIPASS